MKAVDANVIIHGRGLDSDLVTVEEVKEELKTEQARISKKGFNISVMRPFKETLEEVKEKSECINSNTSDADEKLVALALDQDIELLTDDRELQNLGLHLGVEVAGFLDKKIQEKREWKYVCKNCGKETEGKCCGSTPERKLAQRNSV